MTEEQAELLKEMTDKVKTVMEQYKALKDQYNDLIEQKNSLEVELLNVHINYSELMQKYEMLKIARSFSGSKEDKKLLKKKIGVMVRGIDKCIELLNE